MTVATTDASCVGTGLRLGVLRAAHAGQLLRIAWRDTLELLVRMAAVDGDAVEARVGPRRVLLLQSPRLIAPLLAYGGEALTKERALRLGRFMLGDGLVTSEGALHRRQRRLILPVFHRAAIERVATTIVEEANACAGRWAAQPSIDLHAEMADVTLRIVGRAMFGTTLGDDAGRIGRAVSDAARLFDRHRSPLAEILNRLPLPVTIRARRARAVIDDVAARMVAARKLDSARPPDLLTLLLEARDADTGEPLSGRQLRDEIVTILLTGHETTAVALTWAWHLIAGHREVELRLHDEVDTVLADGRVEFGDLAALTYTRQVVSEAMRLYPPVWAFSRQARADVVVGELSIARGTTVIICPYTLHRDERWWSDPARFDPDRFASGVPAPTPFTYLPFSGGPRGCIGEHLAWTECVLVLAILARRWRLCPIETGADPVAPHAGITMRPDRPIPMRLMARGP